jgi:hypothetical protein
MFARAVIAWSLLLLVAVGNGFFRESVLTPRVGRGLGHAISTVMLSVFIVIVGWFTTPWVAPRTIQDAWTVGAIWLGLTLAFEFLAGHFVFGRTWDELLGDYNVFAGKVWVMVLVVTVMTPVAAFTRRGV